MILDAFSEVYGEERRKEEWLDAMLEHIVSEEDIAYMKSIGVNSVRDPVRLSLFYG